MNIQNVSHLVHAYKVAPWRIQRQWIGATLLAVVVLAMIAALYLDVTAKAAIAGREILQLSLEIETNKQITADLQTRYAMLTSASVMQERALDMGFQPLAHEDVEYLLVSGYYEPKPEILSLASRPQLSAITVPPEYSESLLDWFDEKIADTAARGRR